MTEHTNLSVSETTIRKLLDFNKGEWLTLNSIAKNFGVNVETLAHWSKKGTFPIASQLSKEGWRLVSRLQLLQWFKTHGTPHADDYATFRQKYFNTREVGDQLGLRPEQVLSYVNRGIIKPLDSNTGHKQYLAEQVDILKAYLIEQRTKEDNARADAKQKFNDGMKAVYDQMGANQKNKEEAQADIEKRRKMGLEKQVEDYRKSISGK